MCRLFNLRYISGCVCLGLFQNKNSQYSCLLWGYMVLIWNVLIAFALTLETVYCIGSALIQQILPASDKSTYDYKMIEIELFFQIKQRSLYLLRPVSFLAPLSFWCPLWTKKCGWVKQPLISRPTRAGIPGILGQSKTKDNQQLKIILKCSGINYINDRQSKEVLRGRGVSTRICEQGNTKPMRKRTV